MKLADGTIMSTRRHGIKPEKAIEILALMGTPDFTGHTEDILAARHLGIEALWRCLELRKYAAPGTYMPLPGETEE